MSETAVVVNTAVAILAVVVMIVRFKLNPVVSLVVGSAYLGLAVGLGVEGTIDAITGGFGEIMAEVGLLIAFGVLMGAILQQTGAIQRLVETAAADIRPETDALRVVADDRDRVAVDLPRRAACHQRSAWPAILPSGSAGTALPRIATAMAISLECGIV